MKSSQLLIILEQTGLSPEALAKASGVSNMTIRRWLSKKPDTEIPVRHAQAIQNGICRLAAEGRVGADSEAVRSALSGHVLPFHQASLAAMGVSMDAPGLSGKADDNALLAGLSQIGSNEKRQQFVEKRWKLIEAFGKRGNDEWKKRISVIRRALTSSRVDLAGKFVGYGSLFYLLFMPDLIPDCVPVFGVLDDFVMLGIAADFFTKKRTFYK